MLASPCIIISDTHLGAATNDVERSLLGFLRSLRGHAASLVINGDLFDFWFEWRTVMPRRSFRILSALADLHEDGVPVLWIAGNHDCWGGDILREDVGADYHVGPWTGEIAGWRAHLEHGDGLRPVGDRRYRALRSVVRHPAAIRLFRVLHPDLGTRLASGSSEASRIHRPADEGAELKEIALRTLASDRALDLVVFGHSHAPALVRDARGAVYANAGTWLEAPTFLHVTPNRIELRRWTGSAQGECLDAVDRRAEEALAKS